VGLPVTAVLLSAARSHQTAGAIDGSGTPRASALRHR